MMRRVRSREKGWGMHCPGMMTVYGLTETHSGISSSTLADPDEKALYTVGRAYPLNEIRIVDPLTGELKKAGEEGELIVKGFSLMSGYYEDPEQTRERIRDGWLHTGDLGVMDEDGYIKITGRATDMIITGGFNVFPKEIENKILEYPDVVSVSVFGVPDRKYGEVPMAHIILKDGSAAGTDEIKAFCKEKMASYKVPRYVEFVKEFPMNAGGKVQKFRQKEMAVKKLGLED
jgi:fatty-acyl-CoA synthase